MNMIIKEYLKDFFQKLAVLEFGIKNEMESDEVEFISVNYVIKIENYFREIYASIYSIKDPSNEVNLFNLLGYLRQQEDEPQSNYFKKEKNLEESYRKQVNYIAKNILDNIGLINDFFEKDVYEMNYKKFENYWKKRHPELYRTCD